MKVKSASRLASRRYKLVAGILVISALFGTAVAQSDTAPTGKERESSESAKAALDCMRTHDVGNLLFGVSNFGRIGTGMKPFTDCFTGDVVPRTEFPLGTNTTYLYNGGLWIGAVKGRDTLVTCAVEYGINYLEMHSDQTIVHRSTLDPNSPKSWNAISEQDFEATYTDTFTRNVPYRSFDPVENRFHKPLGIAVTQRSFAWSYDYAKDFALLEFTIENIGDEKLQDLYVGLYMDPDAHRSGSHLNIFPPAPGTKGATDGRDDLNGFLLASPSNYEPCEYLDTLGIAWAADNDGDITAGGFVVPSVTGFRLLGDEFDLNRMSFNWWVSNFNVQFDYGPQMKDRVRHMGAGLGTPYGDRNKYHMLSNHEIDFDQAFSATISDLNRTWVAPNTLNDGFSLAGGADAQQVLSVGPYDLNPGDVITVPFAYIGGEDFHTESENYKTNLKDQYRPDLYMAGVDLSDLANNARTAARIFDNPGVDTDGDGYFGKFRVCVLDSILQGDDWYAVAADTVYYEGDGVPDYRGAAPPPAPEVWVYPVFNGLRVRFNGHLSETTRDIFSALFDFEGYRVYIGRDERETSYSLVGTYDRENYDKMVWNPDAEPRPIFELRDTPKTFEELRCLYGRGLEPCDDLTFDVNAYSAVQPYAHPQFPDSIFYFVPHEFNASNFGSSSPIKKVYPTEPEPDPSKAIEPDQLTEDGYLKYYEYELVIEGLLATVPYWATATAFDFGSPETNLAPLESSKTMRGLTDYPAGNEDELTGEEQTAYIFPNPYRIDDLYRLQGYEGLGAEQMPNNRVRQITFANIPPKCKISIHSLDGDLVREMDHNFMLGEPGSRHHVWDLVTRNRQIVVSGLYYWTVEDDAGRIQVGKLVILF